MQKKKGRGRPKGPPTEAITVRLPRDLLREVRKRIGDGESLTGYVARALLAAVHDADPADPGAKAPPAAGRDR